MDAFTLDNPVFRTYVIAAAFAILKMLFHAFLVVGRMIGANGGFLNPEDRRKTFGRARRMHRNEGENTPLFLAAGLIFVAAAPPLWLAEILLYGYVGARFAHFWAYATAQNHEIRATLFTLGALAIATMAIFALYAALAH